MMAPFVFAQMRMANGLPRQSSSELLNGLLSDGQLANHLFRKAGPAFQKLFSLNGICPTCGAELSIEYASNPSKYQGKMLSVIVACNQAGERGAMEHRGKGESENAGSNRWQLDEVDISKELESIIRSLPRGEAELARILNSEAARLNSAWLKTVSAPP